MESKGLIRQKFWFEAVNLFVECGMSEAQVASFFEGCDCAGFCRQI